MEDFFGPPVILPGKASQCIERPKSNVPFPKEPNIISSGRDYAKQFIKEEEKLFEFKQDEVTTQNKNHGPLSEVDTVTDFISIGLSTEDKISVYEKYSYQEKRKPEKNLSIFEIKDHILNDIATHRVVIIKGATGCGKTTQVPQFIFDSAREKNIYCNIVVTQPRRIAALSVAKRVCAERGCELGTLVGYQIGQQKKANDDTRILYCTTGVLLQKLIVSKHMKEFTHVVLDEIHERDQEMDFLLLVVRKLLHTTSRMVKVILMSATIDTSIFTEYFYTVYNKQKLPAFVCEVPEKRKYVVREYFLGDFKDSIPEADEISLQMPAVDKKGYMTAIRLIQGFDFVDEKENEKNGIPQNSYGSVLVFLPGMHEIEEMVTYLESKNLIELNKKEKKKYSWTILPLHSSITYEEQNKVFSPAQLGFRKIILSTNIAESSITVRDIKYVIDFCLTKILVTDPNTNLACLKSEWASRNSLIQRAGRVGRVSDGRVYRLITEQFFYEELEQETIPEMLRCPLNRLILQAKLLDMGEPRAIFGIALSPPDQRNIEQTILLLKEIGALLITANGEINRFDGDLTLLGRIIAKLPMDVRLGKLIFLGNLFNVVEECIIMACAMSVKNIFCSPFKDYLKAYNSKLSWADSTCSDCIAFFNAYTLWRKRRTEGYFRKTSKTNNGEIKWGMDRFIEIKALREIAILEQDIRARLKYSDVYFINEQFHKRDKIEKALFLKLAIAGAFYPNYFFRGIHDGQIDEKEAVNTLHGHDPYTTVYLQGMPSNQPAQLYKNSIRKEFECISNRVNVYFDNGSKVFINFGRSEMQINEEDRCMNIPGKVDLAVYRSIKRRQLETKFTIPVLNSTDANKRYEYYLCSCKKKLEQTKSTCETLKDLPWPWKRETSNFSKSFELSEYIEILISFIESPSHFWIQSTSYTARNLLLQISEVLKYDNNLIPLNENLKIGQIYATTYYDDKERKCCRCRILSKGARVNTYNVYFVDYGKTEKNVLLNDIFSFNQNSCERFQIDKIPDLAVECCLTKVQPPNNSELYDRCWPKEAISIMTRYYLKRNSLAKVYSIVDGTVILKLYLPDSLKNIFKSCITFNQLIIEKKWGEKCEESYLSSVNREERKKMRKLIADGSVSLNVSKKSGSEYLPLLNEEFDSPLPQECTQQVSLRGPFSPLEMKLFSITQCSVPKNVKIERSSVNSVLLDTNPSDTYERMLVAAFVGTNPNGDKLNLRHTTMMPNIPGLPALLCMMFSPMVELRSNPTNTKLAGALCGLGFHKSDKESLFPDNDIELVFDVEFTLDDIENINKFRYWLNKAVSPLTTSQSASEISECALKLQEYIRKILKKKYELQELYYNISPYQWGLIPSNNLLNPCTDRMFMCKHPAEDFSFVYRLIWGVNLDGNPNTDKESIMKNIQQMRDFAEGLISIKSVECVLCRVTLSNGFSVKLHLKSGSHKIRQNRFCHNEKIIEKYNKNEYH